MEGGRRGEKKREREESVLLAARAGGVGWGMSPMQRKTTTHCTFLWSIQTGIRWDQFLNSKYQKY